jgi:di/tricarboxylate transporter
MGKRKIYNSGLASPSRRKNIGGREEEKRQHRKTKKIVLASVTSKLFIFPLLAGCWRSFKWLMLAVNERVAQQRREIRLSAVHRTTIWWKSSQKH